MEIREVIVEVILMFIPDERDTAPNIGHFRSDNDFFRP